MVYLSEKGGNMNEKKLSNKGGRPEKKIDKNAFEKLCHIQCTQEEIADFFECSTDTLRRFCKKEYKKRFCEVYKKKRVGGKISLRRIQFKHAEKNPSMAIWLGKQYLGQQDNPTENTTGEEDKSFNNLIEAIKNVRKTKSKAK